MLLAIDIGGTAIKYGVVTRLGEILMKDSVTNKRTDFNTFLATIYGVIDHVLVTHPLEGIALSVPAVINPKTGKVISEGSMPFLLGVGLSDLIQLKYDLPVQSENDGNCAALAEIWKGAGQSCKDMAMVVIGTGIGGAIVKNGYIHSGANFVSGEFGYFISDYNFAENKFNVWSETGALLTLTERMKVKKGYTLTGIEVFSLAESGDADAMFEVNAFYEANAVGLFNIQYFYDPEIIVLGGAISTRANFVDEIKQRMDMIYKAIPTAPVKPIIHVAAYGNDANLIGAVYHYLQNQK